MDDLLAELRSIEQRIVTYDGPPPEGEAAFGLLPGNIPILISAPHSVRHWRDNYWKQEEEYTAALGYWLHRETGAHFIYGRYALNPDPHADADSGPYKAAIERLFRQTPISLVLDLHGARGDRDFAVALGTMRGESFTDYESALRESFEQHGFSADPESSLDRIVMNPSRYTGGMLQPTITRFAWRIHRIPAVQIELSAWVRVVERLPEATNARNGTAPHFRGDGVRIRRAYEALSNFISARR